MADPLDYTLNPDASDELLLNEEEDPGAILAQLGAQGGLASQGSQKAAGVVGSDVHDLPSPVFNEAWLEGVGRGDVSDADDGGTAAPRGNDARVVSQDRGGPQDEEGDEFEEGEAEGEEEEEEKDAVSDSGQSGQAAALQHQLSQLAELDMDAVSPEAATVPVALPPIDRGLYDRPESPRPDDWPASVEVSVPRRWLTAEDLKRVQEQTDLELRARKVEVGPYDGTNDNAPALLYHTASGSIDVRERTAFERKDWREQAELENRVYLPEFQRIPDLAVFRVQADAEDRARAVLLTDGGRVLAGRAGHCGGLRLPEVVYRADATYSPAVLHDNLAPDPDRGILAVWLTQQDNSDGGRSLRLWVQSYLGEERGGKTTNTPALADLTADSVPMDKVARRLTRADAVLDKLASALGPQPLVEDIQFAAARLPSHDEKEWLDPVRDATRFPARKAEAGSAVFTEGETEPAPIVDIWLKVAVPMVFRDEAIPEPPAAADEEAKDAGDQAAADAPPKAQAGLVKRKDENTGLLVPEDADNTDAWYFRVNMAKAPNGTAKTGQAVDAVKATMAWWGREGVELTVETIAKEKQQGKANPLAALLKAHIRFYYSTATKDHAIGTEIVVSDSDFQQWADGPALAWLAAYEKRGGKTRAAPAKKDPNAVRKPRVNKAAEAVAAMNATVEGGESSRARAVTGWVSLRRLCLAHAREPGMELITWVRKARCRETDVRQLFWAQQPSDADVKDLVRRGLLANTAAAKEVVSTASLGQPVHLAPKDKDTWCSTPAHWFAAVNEAVGKRMETSMIVDKADERLRWALYQLYFFLRQLGLRAQGFPGCELRPFWGLGDWNDEKQWDQLHEMAMACMGNNEAAEKATRLSAKETKLPDEGPWRINSGKTAAVTDQAPLNEAWTRLCVWIASKVRWRFLYVNGDGTVPKDALDEQGREEGCDVELEGPPLFVAHARHFVSVLSLPRVVYSGGEEMIPEDLARRVVCHVNTGAGWVDSYELDSGWADLEAVNLASATLAPVPVPRLRPLARNWCLRWGGTHCFRFRMVEQLVELRPDLAFPKTEEEVVDVVGDGGAKRTALGRQALLQGLIVPFPGHGLLDGRAEIWVRYRRDQKAGRLKVELAATVDASDGHWEKCNGVVLALAAVVSHHVYAALGTSDREMVRWVVSEHAEHEKRTPWNMECRDVKTKSAGAKRIHLYIQPLQRGPPPQGLPLHVRPGEKGVELNAARGHGGSDSTREGILLTVSVLVVMRALQRLPLLCFQKRLKPSNNSGATRLMSFGDDEYWDTPYLTERALDTVWWWFAERSRSLHAYHVALETRRAKRKDGEAAAAAAAEDKKGVQPNKHGILLDERTDAASLPALIQRPRGLTDKETGYLWNFQGVNTLSTHWAAAALQQIYLNDVTWAQGLGPQRDDPRQKPVPVRWDMTVASWFLRPYEADAKGGHRVFVAYYGADNTEPVVPAFSEQQTARAGETTILRLLPEDIPMDTWKKALERKLDKDALLTGVTRGFLKNLTTDPAAREKLDLEVGMARFLPQWYRMQLAAARALRGNDNAKHKSDSRKRRTTQRKKKTDEDAPVEEDAAEQAVLNVVDDTEEAENPVDAPAVDHTPAIHRSPLRQDPEDEDAASNSGSDVSSDSSSSASASAAPKARAPARRQDSGASTPPDHFDADSVASRTRKQNAAAAEVQPKALAAVAENTADDGEGDDEDAAGSPRSPEAEATKDESRSPRRHGSSSNGSGPSHPLDRVLAELGEARSLLHPVAVANLVRANPEGKIGTAARVWARDTQAPAGVASAWLSAVPPGPHDPVPGAFATQLLPDVPLHQPANPLATVLEVSVCRPWPTEVLVDGEAHYERWYTQFVDAHASNVCTLKQLQPRSRTQEEQGLRSAIATLAFLEVLLMRPANPLRLFHLVAHFLAYHYLNENRTRSAARAEDVVDTDRTEGWSPAGGGPVAAKDQIRMAHHEYFAGDADDLCSLYLNILARVRVPKLWLDEEKDTLCLYMAQGSLMRRRAGVSSGEINYDADIRATAVDTEQAFSDLHPFDVVPLDGDPQTDPRSPDLHALLRAWFWTTDTAVLRTGPLGGTSYAVFPQQRLPGQSAAALDWLFRQLEVTRRGIATLAYGQSHPDSWRPWPSDAWVLLQTAFPSLFGGPGWRGLACATWRRWCTWLKAYSPSARRECLRFGSTGPARIDALLEPDVSYVDAAFGTAAMVQLSSSTSTVDKWLVAWDSVLNSQVEFYPFDAMFLSLETTRILPTEKEFKEPQAALAAMSVVLAVCHRTWLEALEWPASGHTYAQWQAHEAVRQFFYSQALLTEPTRARAWKFAHSRDVGRYPLGRWQYGVVARNHVRVMVDRLSQNATLREYAVGLPPVARLRAEILSSAQRIWTQAERFATLEPDAPLWQQSVHLQTRIKALREPGSVINVATGPAKTAAAFSLRNWTLEQNLDYLGPIIGSLAADAGFVNLVGRVSGEARRDIDALDARDAGCRDPTFYQKRHTLQRRESRETPLLQRPFPRDAQAWNALGVFFCSSWDALDPFFTGNRQPSTVDLRLTKLDATQPEFWQQPLLKSAALDFLAGTWRFGLLEPLEDVLRLVVWRPQRGCPAFSIVATVARDASQKKKAEATRLLLDLVTTLGLGPRLLDYVPPVWVNEIPGLGRELAFQQHSSRHQHVHLGVAAVLPKTKPDHPGLYVVDLSDPDQPTWGGLETGADTVRRVEGGIVIDLSMNDAEDPDLVLDVIFTVRALCPYATLSLYFFNDAKTAAQDWCWHPVARPALQMVGAMDRDEHLQLLKQWASGRPPGLVAKLQV